MRCSEQPEGLGFEIFDAKVRAKSHPGIPLNDIGMIEDIGHVYKADTLEELAEASPASTPARCMATVARYNASVAGDRCGRGGPHATCATASANSCRSTRHPFYAYPAKSLMTTTYCGVTINADAQVVDVDGDVIHGLYAIGEVTGGFHGAAYMTGTSLGKGAVFGRIAARARRRQAAHRAWRDEHGHDSRRKVLR